jgi:hypothetical protein
MNRDSEIRDVLLDHSDHQPVRNVFGERTGQGSASIDDYVETIRIANRSLAVIASEGAAEVYAHWNDDQNRYEHLSVSTLDYHWLRPRRSTRARRIPRKKEQRPRDRV